MFEPQHLLKLEISENAATQAYKNHPDFGVYAHTYISDTHHFCATHLIEQKKAIKYMKARFGNPRGDRRWYFSTRIKNTHVTVDCSEEGFPYISLWALKVDLTFFLIRFQDRYLHSPIFYLWYREKFGVDYPVLPDSFKLPQVRESIEKQFLYDFPFFHKAGFCSICQHEYCFCPPQHPDSIVSQFQKAFNEVIYFLAKPFDIKGKTVQIIKII